MTFDNIKELKEQGIDKEITSQGWFTVTQDLVNDFANATKDFQWIHVDAERAKKESPFGGPIAHGFFSLSLIPKFIENSVSVKSVKMGVNYGLNKVRFPHPVPVGSDLRCHFKIVKIEDYPNNGVMVTWNCHIEIKGVEKPACIAEMISLMFE